MFDVETDPRSKTVHGIRDRSENTIFDSWIHDGRRHGYGIHNHIGITSTSRFFDGSSKDPRRCNHLTPCQLGDDDTFRIEHIGLHISFSSREIETEFIRGTVLKLSVGDRPIHYLNAQLLAQPAPFVQRLENVDPTKSGLLLWVDLKKAPIAIPPRQGFYFELEMKQSLKDMLGDIHKQRRGFGMIKVLMKGQHTRAVFEDELSDEDRANMAKRHEEMMLQQKEAQEQAAIRNEEGEHRSHEQMAFLVNTLAPAGTDINPDHIAEAYEAVHAIESAKYAIGGGGHPGGVPPFASMEFGFVEELEIGKAERGFPKIGDTQLDLEDLEEAAWQIAKEYLLSGKPLDESYRKEVAAAVGIDDFESAVPPKDSFR